MPQVFKSDKSIRSHINNIWGAMMDGISTSNAKDIPRTMHIVHAAFCLLGFGSGLYYPHLSWLIHWTQRYSKARIVCYNSFSVPYKAFVECKSDKTYLQQNIEMGHPWCKYKRVKIDIEVNNSKSIWLISYSIFSAYTIGGKNRITWQDIVLP